MNKANRTILELDERLCLKVNGLSGKRVIDKTSYCISKLGDGSIYFFFLAVFIIYLDRPAGIICRDYFTSAGINLIFYKIIKVKVKRKRPFTALESIHKIIPPPDEFSFPSGHSGAAAVFFVCTLHHMSATIALISFFWMILVGISRVYNGVHYPGDVLVGCVMGSSIAKGVILFYNVY